MWSLNKFKYDGALNILKRALGYMSKAGVDLTQPGTPCDVPEQMKEVPDATGLRRENLPASAVESVNYTNSSISLLSVRVLHGSERPQSS